MVVRMSMEECWLLPMCFTCNKAIHLEHAGFILEFSCGCNKWRTETKTNYEIISKEDVAMQTLYFNHVLTKENLEWIGKYMKHNRTMDLYNQLRRKVVLEEI